MAKQREVQVTVSGGTGFPVDMLRYDGLSPDSEQDSYKIEASVRYESKGPQTVVLRRWVEGTHWKPTAARWESFLWHVDGFVFTGRQA